MATAIYFIHPTTCEKIKASTKEDVKRYTACGWRRVKKIHQYDVRTGKKIQ